MDFTTPINHGGMFHETVEPLFHFEEYSSRYSVSPEKQLTIALSFALGNSQLFPDPPESLKPNKFSCCPPYQSLSV